MDKHLMLGREGRSLKRGVAEKPYVNTQAFSVEVSALLDVFARIELRRQEKRRISKEVR
jgi:hypothetical protein